MKFKVGDKVRVRKDLEAYEEYGNFDFSESMEKYKGKIVTIKAINSDSYFIGEDNGDYYWTDEMFEGLARFTKSDLQRGDIVTDSDGDISVFDGEKLVGSTLEIDYLNETLGTDDGDCQIVKVERPAKLETIWVRSSDDLTEMTIEEIENKLGLTSGSLRIKKED